MINNEDRKDDVDSLISREEQSVKISNKKDSVWLAQSTKEIESPDLKNTMNGKPMPQINEDVKKLAGSIIKRQTMPNGIYPNQTIMKGGHKSTKTLKYSMNMYNPALNIDTLQNFFSVKLVKTQKPIKTVSLENNLNLNRK